MATVVTLTNLFIMEPHYHFTHLKSKNFNILTDKTAADYLKKWSMQGQIKVTTFGFNEPFQIYQKDDLVNAFFKDPVVIANLNNLFPCWPFDKDMIEEIDVEMVPCTKISMDFFDRVLDPKNRIVRANGHLHHCVDDYRDEFMISDELRKMILDEESDNYGLFNETERKEFLFRVFQHLILGGKWCQFEDIIDPYLTYAKMLYKDLVRVERNQDTKDIEIRSYCLKITVIGKKNSSIFPVDSDHHQNFVYLIIDPVVRHITVFGHEFGGQF